MSTHDSVCEPTNCRRAAAMVCPRPSPPRRRWSALRRRADGNVAAVCHGQHVPTPTASAAWRNTAVNKAAWWPWPLTLKVVSESRVTWATSVPILVFLDLSVRDLGPMYETDRRKTKASLNARLLGAGHNNHRQRCSAALLTATPSINGKWKTLISRWISW